MACTCEHPGDLCAGCRQTNYGLQRRLATAERVRDQHRKERDRAKRKLSLARSLLRRAIDLIDENGQHEYADALKGACMALDGRHDKRRRS